MTFAIIALFAIGWIAAALLGTQAYFRGEQTKPIHSRNWNNANFDALAESFTGDETDYSDRIPAYRLDAYGSRNLSA